MKPIAVIGAGSWGTALSILLGRNGYSVYLWSNETDCLQEMSSERINRRYLPEVELPDPIIIASDLSQTFEACNDILLVVPSHVFSNVLQSIKPLLRKEHRIAWATKGLDPKHGCLLHEVFLKEIGSTVPYAVISGPSFAKEVAKGLPTAITVASHHAPFSKDLVKYFSNKSFRLNPTEDVVGVELGGAIKNVLAIAAGVSDGLGYGANSRSALIIRGLSEMIALGTKMGGQSHTFIGLAGLGDLILTATDQQSRNQRFGLALGRGASVEETEKSIGQVIEGKITTQLIYQLAQQHQVRMPITEQMYKMLYEHQPPELSLQTLLSQPI